MLVSASRRRRCQSVFAPAALAAAGLLAASAPGGSVPPIPIRMVTLNVLQGIGVNGSVAYEAAGKFLTTNDLDGAGPNSGLSPHIVGLQECTNINDVNAFRDEFLPGYQVERIFQVDAGGNFNVIMFPADYTMLDFDSIATPGPRRVIRCTLQVPNALKTLTVYVAHFKAFGDSGSVATRTAEANAIGQVVYEDRTLGLDLDDNGSREAPAGDFVVMGDLNSNNNLDGSLNGLFTHSTLGVPTGVLNLPVESIGGQSLGGAPLLATYPSSGSRLDYICLDQGLAAQFDTNSSGTFDQTELNSMGFVYYAGDDGGAQANGDISSTGNASDHRPVVFDFVIERDPLTYFDPMDIDQDFDVDLEDLQLWENLRALGTAPDVDGNAIINDADRDAIRNHLRSAEAADVVS